MTDNEKKLWEMCADGAAITQEEVFFQLCYSLAPRVAQIFCEWVSDLSQMWLSFTLEEPNRTERFRRIGAGLDKKTYWKIRCAVRKYYSFHRIGLFCYKDADGFHFKSWNGHVSRFAALSPPAMIQIVNQIK